MGSVDVLNEFADRTYQYGVAGLKGYGLPDGMTMEQWLANTPKWKLRAMLRVTKTSPVSDAVKKAIRAAIKARRR